MSTFFATPWTAACQAPLSMRFSRQEYWRGFHALLQRIFPTHWSNLHLLHWQADSLSLSPQGRPYTHMCKCIKKRREPSPLPTHGLFQSSASKFFLQSNLLTPWINVRLISPILTGKEKFINIAHLIYLSTLKGPSLPSLLWNKWTLL